MARNNLTTTAIAVAATLAVAYTGSAWYFGKQIEAAHRQIDERIADIPYLKLVRHDYDRTLFGASEVITLELAPALFHLPKNPKPVDDDIEVDPVLDMTEDTESSPDSSDDLPIESSLDSANAPELIAAQPAAAAQEAMETSRPPVQISINSIIKHGPFPGFAGLGAGRAETTITFDEAIQKELDAAFDGKAALTASTLYEISGGGQSQISSPPFKTEQKLETTGKSNVFSSAGLEMSVRFTKDFAQYEVQGDAPRFEISDSTGAGIVVSGLRLEDKETRLFADEPLFYVGTQKLTLAELSVNAGEENIQKFSIKGFNYEIDSPLTDEHIDLNAKMGASEVLIGEQNYGPVHYDFSFKHLHAKKLAALYRKSLGLYAQPDQMQDPAQIARMFEPLKEELFALLADNLVFNIERMSFHTADGDANLSASLKLNGAAPIDFASPLSLLPKVDFTADLAFPATLPALMQSGPTADEAEIAARKQAAEQSLAIFVQQGYATNEAGLVKSKIVFNGKELLVNGQPFNPLSLAPARQ